ncbi:hypothetical protein ES703_101749 [subsurface metagenome]
MTQGLWKKLFIATTVLLVSSVILYGNLWYQLNDTKIQLNNTIAELNAIKAEMENLKNEQNWLPSDYNKLREQINLRLGVGQDGQSF